MRIGGLILSRLDSKRLPSKALLKLGNKPLVEWVVDAISQVEWAIPVLATSNEIVDYPLVQKAQEKGINYFTGSKNDIAKRIIDCCEQFSLDYFYRINGDSPFVNLPLYHEAFAILETEQHDIISNLINRTFPYGIACELIQFRKFKATYSKFSLEEKEHITSFYYKNIKEFTFAEVNGLSRDESDVRFTIDTPADLTLLNEYIDHSGIKDFNNIDALSLVDDFKDFIR